MKRQWLVIAVLFMGLQPLHAQRNPLWIPDTLSGPDYTLTLTNAQKHYFPGDSTHTMVINDQSGGHNGFWGPTLIMNRGQNVQMHVVNKIGDGKHMPDTTTMHWHGIHLPPIMDGGPHQPIPPDSTWSPFWTVDDPASTYWYHPHLHHHTAMQVAMGLGGFLIVRDSIEGKLALPRTYGVDDIPLVLSSRVFGTIIGGDSAHPDTMNNQFILNRFGDYMLVNGTLHAEHTMPAQVVRMRLLNAALEQSFNVGFRDKSGKRMDFHIISTDGGLVDKPVKVKEFLISPGERIELLADFTGMQGDSVDMMSYNSDTVGRGDVAGFVGKDDKLSGRDFEVLHYSIGAPTANPITSIPTQLTTNVFWDSASASITRHINMLLDTTMHGPPFRFDQEFDMNVNNYTVDLDAIEIWEIYNPSTVAHPFHIHDISFYILSRNGKPAPPQEQGWKDVVLVQGDSERVRFIAQFDDFADPIHPYMYHCHILPHEDGGMMGQFVVVNKNGITPVKKNGISVYPNPTQGILNLEYTEGVKINSTRIVNMLGANYYTSYDRNNRIDVSHLPAGVYELQSITDQKEVINIRFIKL